MEGKEMAMARKYHAVESPIGEILIESLGRVPTRIILPGWGINGEPRMDATPPLVQETAAALRDYFEGKDPGFSFARRLLASAEVSPFGREVLERVGQIPRGCTSTYGEVAARVGNPRAARAVGGVMHGNPFPIIIPCHRVVRSDGSIGGFGAGSNTKKWLLQFEGASNGE